MLFTIAGGLAMFLYGMKIMSDGLQQSAGDRMRKTVSLMTSNRITGLLTGSVATAIIQSSTAFTVIVISFANAGIISLSQSIPVILGTNIGTTFTGWIVSVFGFKISIASLALPSIGIGFLLGIIKWKYKSIGGFLMGFGFLFLGLHYLTLGMADIHSFFDFAALGALRDNRPLAILIGFGAGALITIILNSSSATTAIIMTMTYSDIIPYEMAAAMIMGTNVGTTFSAPLVSITGNIESKRVAMTHVLFNVIGSIWAIPLLIPLLKLINIIVPGDPWAVIPNNAAIPLHLAGLHTVFNLMNALLFLPFIGPFTKLIYKIVPEKQIEEKGAHYKFAYLHTGIADLPALNILRAEKEIRDMAGVVYSMYTRFSTLLKNLRETEDRIDATAKLAEELKQQETYVDEMREVLTAFLIECTRQQLNARTERRVSLLLRVIGYVEDMSDDCYSISILMGKSAEKKRIFSEKEMEDLIPYLDLVQEFIGFLKLELGQNPTIMTTIRNKKLESDINKSRKELAKIGRKNIEAGKDVKTELFFIDLVRRIEKLGDYCFDISSTLGKLV